MLSLAKLLYTLLYIICVLKISLKNNIDFVNQINKHIKITNESIPISSEFSYLFVLSIEDLQLELSCKK